MDYYIFLLLFLVLYILILFKDIVIFSYCFECILLYILLLMRNNSTIYILEGQLRLYIYTFFGSIFLLFSLIYLLNYFNSSNELFLLYFNLFNFNYLGYYIFNVLFLLVFLIKLPIYPFIK